MYYHLLMDDFLMWPSVGHALFDADKPSHADADIWCR